MTKTQRQVSLVVAALIGVGFVALVFVEYRQPPDTLMATLARGFGLTPGTSNEWPLVNGAMERQSLPACPTSKRRYSTFSEAGGDPVYGAFLDRLSVEGYSYQALEWSQNLSRLDGVAAWGGNTVFSAENSQGHRLYGAWVLTGLGEGRLYVCKSP